MLRSAVLAGRLGRCVPRPQRPLMVSSVLISRSVLAGCSGENRTGVEQARQFGEDQVVPNAQIGIPVPRVKAVILDAFGTVLKIHKGCHPYRQVLKIGRLRGRGVRADDAKIIMTNPLSLEAAAAHFGIALLPSELERIQAELDSELQRIEPYEDALLAIEALQSAGIKVAICSNLALPYREPIERLFPGLDGYGYSFEVGALKPDTRIYRYVIDQLGVAAHETWMIGDSQQCDRDGPTKFGIKGHYLDRCHTRTEGFAELRSFIRVVLNSNKS